MPRGRKKSTQESIQEQVEKIEEQIQSHQNKISDLQEKRKDLLERKKKSEVELIYQKIQESGKSIDEILKIFDQE